ncbi:hypothetical protein NVP1121O_034 [Vibrio phage 1.121.O._10N.286.46.C4]|nr:hypothetical protein NVP1121O_034 [Vibrio phage 1.121.O._10N.286.46.C4]
MRKFQTYQAADWQVNLVEGVDNGAGNAVVLELPKILSGVQLSGAGIVTTATGAVVPAVVGDDITIMGSIDGTNYFNLGDANAWVVYGLDDNGVVTLAPAVKYLQFTAAQIQATETWSMNVVFDSAQ